MIRLIFFAILLVFMVNEKIFADDVHDFLEKAKSSLDSKTDQAHLKMTIREASGEEKVREMTLQILRTKNGLKALVRMTAPPDMKGTALLSEIADGKDQEWLYIPASKQIRRIASSKTSTGVLGSELKMEDLNPMAIKEAKVTLTHTDPQAPQIIVIPAPQTSEYTQIITTFSMPHYLPVKTEYFKGASKEKTVQFLDYKVYADHIYRAQRIEIKNLQKNRGTDLDLTDIKVNAPLSAQKFTPAGLKESW